ncbi:MAG: hypothetical protein ACRESC_01195 [Gammaproteobacteria bacterium]
MRIFMGIVWFVVCFVALYILFSVVLAVIIANTGDITNMQGGIAFAQAHATVLSLCRWSMLIVAVVFAVLGTWKRVLPGTKDKQAKPAA